MKNSNEAKIIYQKNNFGIIIAHCGKESRKVHVENKRRVERFALSYLTKGKGYYTINGKRYTIKKGDIYGIFQNVEYSQENDKDDPCEYYYVGFFGSDCLSTLEHAGLTVENPIVSLNEKDGNKVSSKMKAIYNLLGEDSYLNIAKAVVKLLEIFCILFEQQQENTVVEKEENAYVEDVKKYIEAHILEPIKVNNISRNINIDRTYLSHIFSKVQNMSIKEYIDRCKVDKAMGLLRENKIQISELANYLGYDNYVTFYRQFMKYAGFSPVEYKKKNVQAIQDYKGKREE